jgi:hypothetical protein
MATKLDKTAGGPATLRPANALAPAPVNSLLQAVVDPFARAYQTYQQHIGQPFQQAVRGGVRGYFGLPLMSDASSVGREAYRQGEALGFAPGVGMPAGAVRVAAEGVQALPSIAGDIGRVIGGLPSKAAARQFEDFAAYQRSIPPSDVSPLTAYHGTPHTFPAEPELPLGRFRAEKIGTGEGAQAYGYGMYFAESPGAAGYYKELPGKDTKTNEGSLYKVDIPDVMVGNMLDWNKPLSQQPGMVKKVFENGWQHALYRQRSGRNVGDFTGADLVRSFGTDTRSSVMASEQLRQAGIPGIRYLDQTSRADGEGTRNIVVFPGEEKNVKILSRD